MYALHSCMYAKCMVRKNFRAKCIHFKKNSGWIQEMHGKSQDFPSKMHSNDEKLVKCIACLAKFDYNACMHNACLGKIPKLHTMSEPCLKYQKNRPRRFYFCLYHRPNTKCRPCTLPQSVKRFLRLHCPTIRFHEYSSPKRARASWILKFRFLSVLLFKEERLPAFLIDRTQWSWYFGKRILFTMACRSILWKTRLRSWMKCGLQQCAETAWIYHRVCRLPCETIQYETA